MNGHPLHLGVVGKEGKARVISNCAPSYDTEQVVDAPGRSTKNASPTCVGSWYVANPRDGMSCSSADTCIQDECNKDGVNGKQGGLYGDDCAGYWLTMVDH